MSYAWLSIIPPILVIIMSLITRNVRLSLITGILASAALVTHGSPLKTITFTLKKLMSEGLTSDHLALFSFLILLGILVELMNHTGGIHAYTKLLRPHLHSKKAVETTSLLLSFSFFIDDYLNNLTTGNVMRPLTDHFKIPRAKLAFLIDSMSAPLCVIIPASSWVAMILGLLQASNVQEPFNAYLSLIPFLFYPILLVISAFFIVQARLSFGAMRTYEQVASTTGNLFGDQAPIHPSKEPVFAEKSSLYDFIIPLGSFLVTMFGMILYLGNSTLLGGSNNLLTALQQTNPFIALLVASIVSLVLSIPFFLLREKLALNKLYPLSIAGFMLMKNSLIVLLLAWTFGSILNHDLALGSLMGGLLSASLATFIMPVIFFGLSLFISATTGSAWGTMTIMVALVIPLISGVPGFFLAQSIAAIIAGAIAGGHMSPITDSMVLASASAGCYHMDHVQTQMSYALPAVIGSAAAFFITGCMHQYSASLALLVAYGAGLCITLGMLYIRGKRN